jgi:hypothetical protein
VWWADGRLVGGGSCRARVKELWMGQLSPCAEPSSFETKVVSCVAVSASFAWARSLSYTFSMSRREGGLGWIQFSGIAEAEPTSSDP